MPASRYPAFFSALFTLGVLLSVAGCDKDFKFPSSGGSDGAGTAGAQELKVVCLLADARMPFQRAQAQFLQLLDANDASHSLEIMEATGDGGRQISQIEALIPDPPAALLLQPVDLAACAPALSSLRAAGTRVIAFDLPDSAPEESGLDAALLCDPAEIGRAAAELTVRALQRRASDRGESTIQGRVMEIRGSDSSPWCHRVHEGFASALSRHPEIVLVHDAAVDWLPSQVSERYAEALRLQKAIDVIFAHDDYIAQAAGAAAQLSGTRDDTLIIGVNGFAGSEGGLEMIRRNEIDATIQRPYLVDYAWSQLKQSPPAQVTAKFHPRAILPADIDSAEILAPPVPDTAVSP